MKLLKVIAIMISLLTSIGTFASEARQDSYGTMKRMSMKQLFERGTQLCYPLQKSDSALIYFNILTDRYNNSLSKADKDYCVKAYIYKWAIAADKCDFAKQYENLVKAQHICDESGIERPEIELHLGFIYQNLFEQTGDTEMLNKAIKQNKKSFNLFINNSNTKYLDFANTAITNLLLAVSEIGKIGYASNEMSQYSRLKTINDPILFEYNLMLYHGLKQMEEKRFDDACTTFMKQNAILPDTVKYVRNKIITFEKLAEAHRAKGDMQNAIKYMMATNSLVDKYGITDCKLEVLNFLSSYFEQTNDHENAAKWRKQYYQLKDSILNFQQISSLNDVITADLMQQEKAKYDNKQRQTNLILFFTLLLFAVAVVTLLAVRIKNKRLNKRNRALYDKNIELLKAQNEESRQRQLYEQQVSKLTSTIEQLRGEKAKVSDYNTKSKPQLSQETKDLILQRILLVMDNEEEICNPQFNINHLAMLIKSNQKYVSQIINDVYGVNFSNFLNRYRIKIACNRLLSDNKYANYTIEAISQEMGYKSRTSFISAFKRETGLTPSEFQKVQKNI